MLPKAPVCSPRRLIPSPATLALATVTLVLSSLLFIHRPLTAPLAETVQIADLTWVELRSLVRHGYTTAIVPSGGLEQNGVHLTIGKHDHIVAYTAARIATALGGTLVTPVVSFVPQGDYANPTGNLRFPGTIGVPEAVFAGTLEGIARSLKLAGFKTICLIADHSESLPSQKAVAGRLAHEWAEDGVKVISVDGYNADPAQLAWLKSQGETDASIGQHGGIQDTAELMASHPASVKMERWANRPYLPEATGSDGDPARATPEMGVRLLDLKIEAALREIRAATGRGITLRASVAD